MEDIQTTASPEEVHESRVGCIEVGDLLNGNMDNVKHVLESITVENSVEDNQDETKIINYSSDAVDRVEDGEEISGRGNDGRGGEKVSVVWNPREQEEWTKVLRCGIKS